MTTPEPTDENAELIRDYYEAWDAGDPDAIAAFFADDFSTTYTDLDGAEHRVDPEDVHDWIAGWLEIIAEMTHDVHELVAEGDRVMARITYRGIHDGTLFGIEPTGNRVEVEEFVSFRIEDGQIVAFEWLGDDVALLRQLGVELPIET